MITGTELRQAFRSGTPRTWHQWRVQMVASSLTFSVLAVGLRVLTGSAPWLLWSAWLSFFVATSAASVKWGERLVIRVLLGTALVVVVYVVVTAGYAFFSD